MTAELRRATPDDFAAIADLLAEVFPANPKADAAVLRWQYLEGPGGPASSWVWDDGGRIVSHFTMLRYPAVIEGDPVVVGKSADAATLPSHRGRGMFPQAVGAALDDLRKQGAVGAMFSPSNPTSRRSLERIGMEAVAAPAPAMVRLSLRSLRPDPPRSADDGIHAHDVDLFQAAADGCNAAVDHSPAWAAWRFSRPGADYLVGRSKDGDGRSEGVAVGLLRRRGRLQVLYVLELAGTTKQARRVALRQLVSRARARVTGPLVAVAVAGTCPEQKFELASAGMYGVAARLSPGGFTFGMIPLDDVGGFPLVKRPWRLTWADLDHL